MNTVITYVIATIVSLGTFYIAYAGLLRKEPLFRFNRIYLLTSLSLSYLIPLVIFVPDVIVPSILKSSGGGLLYSFTLSPVEITATAGKFPSLSQFLVYVYLGGMAFFLTRLFFRLLRIYQLANIGLKTIDNNTTILWSQADIPPFSFFRTMYLPLNLKGTQHVNEIIRHEQVHINSMHSFDILFTQLMQTIFWYNPFIMLIEKALREIHEFEADKAVIHAGINPAEYTRILFEQDKTALAVILGNNFNYSLIKRRLSMFYKKSTRLARIKAIVVLPMIACIAIIFAFSCRQSTEPLAPPPPPPPPPPPTELATPVDDVFTVVENMPQYPGGENARIEYMAKNLKYPESAIKNKLEGTVYISFIIEKDGAVNEVTLMKGIGGECDAEALRIIKNMPHWIPGTQRGQAVRVKFTLPIKFKLSDNGKSGMVGYDRNK